MRVGVLCEGEFTDVPALKVILRQLFPETTFDFIGTDKGDLYANCDLLLAELERRGAERILILWDLHPPGVQLAVPSQRLAGRICRYQQRQTLLEGICRSSTLQGPLKQQALHHASRYRFPPYDQMPTPPPDPDGPVFVLVSVASTMEAWFLSDATVLMDLGSTPQHRAPRKSFPHPDQVQQPEVTLKEYFGQCPNKRMQRYNKVFHNKQLAEAYCASGRVQEMMASESFRRMISTLQTWGAS